MNNQLHKIAPQIESFFDHEILDSNGVLYSLLKLAGMRAFLESDFGKDIHRATVLGQEDLPYSDFMNYENTGMVQGTFLSAMCLKYRVTQDRSALVKAQRTFRGIRKIYEMSQSVALGFYCKPWGFRTQSETSSDQYIYTMTGLDDYYDFAAPEEKEQIRSMMIAMTSFWLDHNYDWMYYGRPLQWPECRFIAFMAFAVKYGGGARFEKELKRLVAKQEMSGKSPFASTRMERMFKDDRGRDCINAYPETCLSTYLSFAPAIQSTPSDCYLRILLDSYEVGKESIAEDGTVYDKRILVPATGEYHEIPAEETFYDPKRNWIPLACLDGPVRKGGMQSTMFSRFALCLADMVPSCAGREFAEKVLTAVGTKHLTWMEDPFGILPEPLRWMTDVFSCDAAAHWLWCYWKLRSLKK